MIFYRKVLMMTKKSWGDGGVLYPRRFTRWGSGCMTFGTATEAVSRPKPETAALMRGII